MLFKILVKHKIMFGLININPKKRRDFEDKNENMKN